MNAKFLIAWLVMFILFMAAGFVVHATLLHEDYLATGLFRTDADQQQYMVWMIVAHVLLAGAFTWIYARGVEAKAWLGQGLRFGLAVALLTCVPYYLIYYSVQPLPGMLVVKQVVFDGVALLIMGVVVAWLYRGQGRA